MLTTKKAVLFVVVIMLFLVFAFTPMMPAHAEPGSTIYLSDSGWSDPLVGTWDPATRTAMLTQDVTETIEIVSDNLILDGQGYTLTGSGDGYGVYLSGRVSVTLKNVTVQSFLYGIFLWGGSNNNNLTSNTVYSNGHYGIILWGSCSNNILQDNTAYSNGLDGIVLYGGCNSNNLANNSAYSNGRYGIWVGSYSNNNNLTGNTANQNNQAGIHIYDCTNNNNLMDNTANQNNGPGIYLSAGSSFNNITDNTASDNNRGIYVSYNSDNNAIAGNTASGNDYGIDIYYSRYNKVYNNNFINNDVQAYKVAYSDTFNLPKPTGGNYWSDWTSPDDDDDGFVDYPYVFTGGQDYLPWAEENGWLSPPSIETVSITPLVPNYYENVYVSAGITDNVEVDQAILSYSANAEWQNISMIQTDDTFQATIPAQPYETNVQYKVYANDTNGNEAESDIYSYTVIDNRPPQIASVQCTPLLSIRANVSEPPGASGVDKVLLYLRIGGGEWWSTALKPEGALWTTTIFGYNQIAGKTIEYYVEAYDEAGNKETGTVLNRKVEEWRIADLNRDGKVDRADLLIVTKYLKMAGPPLLGFASFLIGSVVYVKHKKKKQT